jgi:hypothetical protein
VITRDNIDQMIDAGRIAINVGQDRWVRIRRNGATKRWRRDPHRIRIPFMIGPHQVGTITSNHFLPTGELDPAVFKECSDG